MLGPKISYSSRRMGSHLTGSSIVIGKAGGSEVDTISQVASYTNGTSGKRSGDLKASNSKVGVIVESIGTQRSDPPST